MMRVRSTVLLVLLIAIATLGQSQAGGKSLDQLPASMRKLVAVSVTGSKRYSENDIIAASGLQIGTTLTADDLKKAARHLGDLGVFSDIAYNYSYSSEGTKL